MGLGGNTVQLFVDSYTILSGLEIPFFFRFESVKRTLDRQLVLIVVVVVVIVTALVL